MGFIFHYNLQKSTAQSKKAAQKNLKSRRKYRDQKARDHNACRNGWHCVAQAHIQKGPDNGSVQATVPGRGTATNRISPTAEYFITSSPS
jgi:hypothetical protein